MFSKFRAISVRSWRTKIKDIIIHPMVLTGLLIAMLFSLFVYANLGPELPLDGYLLGFIGIVAILSCVFMALRTKWADWNLFGTSLFYHFLAVALLYLMVVFYDYNPQVGHYLHVLNLTRSALLVSGAGVMVAVVLEWYQDFRASRSDRKSRRETELTVPKEHSHGNESI